MIRVIDGHVYDYPKYYDLVFGSDWKAEYDFLEAVFAAHVRSPARRPVRRLLEPACGTGRLLVKFAEAGYEVAGIDLNAKAIEYCNRRLAQHGFAELARVADMADFRQRPRCDAAFNMINSFRHLPSEHAARRHLACMADSLTRGGVYALGLHLTPKGQPTCDQEAWSARRGHLAVNSNMWSIKLDRRRRNERVGMTMDVHTPTRQFRLVDELQLRTYTRRQFQQLVAGVPEFEIAATYDFAYAIDEPIQVDDYTEDVVYILRKR